MDEKTCSRPVKERIQYGKLYTSIIISGSTPVCQTKEYSATIIMVMNNTSYRANNDDSLQQVDGT